MHISAQKTLQKPCKFLPSKVNAKVLSINRLNFNVMPVFLVIRITINGEFAFRFLIPLSLNRCSLFLKFTLIIGK